MAIPTLDEIYGNQAKPSLDDIYGQAAPPDVSPPAESSSLLRRAADVPLGLLKGAIGLPEAAIGLADIATGGYAGKAAESLGFRPKEAKEIINTWQSPELNQARQNVQNAKGFFPTLGAMIENPSTIADAAAESAPSMIGGAGIARGAMRLAPKLGGAVAAGLGEGVATAGLTAEQVRQESPDGLLNAKQMVAPVVAGAITGGLGVMGGKIAQKLGIADIDTMLATGVIKQSEHGLLRRVAEGAFSEGILEELPQSAQEQVAQNVALNKPWNEGVAEAAASGMLVGGLMGGGGNVLSSAPAKTDLTARTQPEAAPEQPAAIKTGNPLTDALATVAPVEQRPDTAMEEALSPAPVAPQVEDTAAPVDLLQTAEVPVETAPQPIVRFDPSHLDPDGDTSPTGNPYTPWTTSYDNYEADNKPAWVPTTEQVAKAEKDKPRLEGLIETKGGVENLSVVQRRQWNTIVDTLAAAPPQEATFDPKKVFGTVDEANAYLAATGETRHKVLDSSNSYRDAFTFKKLNAQENAAAKKAQEATNVEDVQAAVPEAPPTLNGPAQTNYADFAPQQKVMPQGYEDIAGADGMGGFKPIQKGGDLNGSEEKGRQGLLSDANSADAQETGIPALTIDQVPNALVTSGFTESDAQAVVKHLNEVVAYGNELLVKSGGKPDVNPVFSKSDIQEAIDTVVKKSDQVPAGRGVADLGTLPETGLQGDVATPQLTKLPPKDNIYGETITVYHGSSTPNIEFMDKNKGTRIQSFYPTADAAANWVNAKHVYSTELNVGDLWDYRDKADAAALAAHLFENKPKGDSYNDILSAIESGRPTMIERGTGWLNDNFSTYTTNEQGSDAIHQFKGNQKLTPVLPADLPSVGTVTAPVSGASTGVRMADGVPTPAKQSEWLVKGVHRNDIKRTASVSVKAATLDEARAKVSEDNPWFAAKDFKMLAPAPQAGQAPVVQNKQDGLNTSKEVTRTGPLPAADYIITPRAADGRVQMFYRGTTNEVFPNQTFKTPVEARNYLKAERVKEKGVVTNYRTADETGRVNDGKGGIKSGEVFKTSSGRLTTPFPNQKGQKYLTQWVIDNAVAEAESRGDKWNAGIFKNTTMLKGGNLTTADNDSMHQYLYGEQPAVPKPFLKPLSPSPAAAVKTTPAEVVTEAVKVAKQEGTPLKEQKKFLLENIEDVIKDAADSMPKEHIALKNELDDLRGSRTEAGNRMADARSKLDLWSNPELFKAETADHRAEMISEFQKAYDVAIADAKRIDKLIPPAKQSLVDAGAYVTIHVPDDGTFQVYNSKEALKQFKEQVAKMFPVSSESKTKEGYGNPPKPRGGQSITQMDGVDFATTSGTWHTNGHVIVKGKAGVPLKVDKANAPRWEAWRSETPENNQNQINRVIPDPKNTSNKQETVTYVNLNNRSNPHEAVSDKPLRNVSDGKESDALFAVIQSGDKFTSLSAEYYNYVNKQFPKAEWFIADKSDHPVVAKVDGEVVAVVMPMRAGINNAVQLAKDYIGYSSPKLSRAAAQDNAQFDLNNQEANSESVDDRRKQVTPESELSALSDELINQGFDRNKVKSLQIVETPKALQAIAKAMESSFGTRINFITGLGGMIGGARVSAAPNTIFVSADNTSGKPHLMTMGHELLHVLRARDKQLYDDFINKMSVTIGGFERFKRTLDETRTSHGMNPSTDPAAMEELMANFVGDRMLQYDFWNKFYKNDPSLTQKVAQYFKDAVNKVLDYFKEHGKQGISAQYFQDIKRAQYNVVQFLNSHTKKVSETKRQNPDIQFSLDDGAINGNSSKKTIETVSSKKLGIGGDTGGRYSKDNSFAALPTSRAEFTDYIKTAVQKVDLFDKLATNIFDNGMVVSRWGRSVGTMYHIASKKGNEQFKKVFDHGQQFITDINSFAAKAEALAPSIFPKFGIGAGMLKSVSKADNALITTALHEGTLLNGASPTSGKIWSDEELTEKYGMNKEQRTMYHEARAAVNRSLDDMAKSTMFTYALRAEAGENFRQYKEESVHAIAKRVNAEIDKKIKDVREKVDDNWLASASEYYKDPNVAELEKLKSYQESVLKVATTTESLKAHGYFPLSRFGDHTVTVKDGDKVVYYGMYEGAHDAVKAMRSLALDFPNHNIKRGTIDKEAYKIYGGLTLEAVELFAEHMDKEDTKPYQEYLKNAVNNRSAMKHMINRKGTSGYSSDGVRTLANFIYSNARFASKNLNMKLMAQEVQAMEKNDLSAMARKLQEYLNNPVEEFSKLRGFMFIHYLGGSVASGITNMTQVVLSLAPYLAQNTSANNVVKQVSKAAKDAFTDPSKLKDPIERQFMMELDEEGETAPQEIHQLAAIASNHLGASNPIWNAGLKAWGSIFSVTEIFNRRTTALAAFRIATENGKSYAEAKAEAIKAIKETQFIYNKGNRPMWGRGVLGAPLFTFKQFSVMYLELFARLPQKQKLMMLGLLMMASGAEGLPFAGDLEDLIDTIGQWLGHGTNSKRWLKEKVGGTPVGDFFLKGISSVAPIDVQGRLGMNNLIPGTAILKQSSTDKGRDVKEFFGPMGGLFTAASDSLELLAKGQVGRAVKAASPRAIQGIATGVEAAVTGKTTDKYGRKTFDATPVEAAEKFVGFNPSRMADESQTKMGLMQDKQLLTVRTDEIVNELAQAKMDRNADGQRDALAKWRKWNADNPELKIPAIHQKVANRIKVLQSTSKDRFLKSTPKSQRAAVAAELS